MRIVDAREITVPIGSSMRNAAIDFSGMTVSIAALVTDQTRDGNPVIGYGFNSNGRYAQGGILHERLFPRILSAPPDSLCDPDTGVLDPTRIWDAAMRNEKPGGHGERAVAMAVIDMAAWDLAAKLAGLPLHVLLGELFPHASRSTAATVYAAGGYYTEGGIADVQHELLGYVDEGYRAVKMKVGGAPLGEDVRRIEAVRSVLPDGVTLAVDANARLDLDTAVEYAKRSSRMISPGSRSPAPLSITRRLPGWRSNTRLHSPRARISSPPTTSGTCCATADCGLTGTCSSRIRAWPTVSPSSSECSTYFQSMGGCLAACRSTAVIS